jgi:HK97 family phage major capsid protein
LSRNYVGARRQAQARQAEDAWARLAAGLDGTDLRDVQDQARRDPAVAQLLKRGRDNGRIRAAARDLAAVPDDGRPEPAGAALDGFKWARSWGAYLTAIKDKSDPQGARAAIQRLRDSRPRNAMSERIPAEGGFLVPERLRQQVLSYMMGSIVRPRSTVIPLDSQRVPVPTLENPSQASSAQALGGLTFSFTEEGQAIPASVPNFGRVVLEAWPDKALLQNVPNELLADSPAFTDFFLPQLIAKGLAWHVDDFAIYQGTGVGQPQALVNAPGAVAVTRSDPSGFHVSHLDVVTMLRNLHPASKCTATWLASEDMFDQLLELYEIIGTAPSGQDIPPPGTLKFNSESGRWELLGLEIVANDHQPALNTAGDLMLADLSLLLLGERDSMAVEVAPHTGFAADTSQIRIRYRWDSRFWPQSTITLANGKVTSPLVVLH